MRGNVKKYKQSEVGLTNIYKKNDSEIIHNFFKNKKSYNVWISHADQV